MNNDHLFASDIYQSLFLEKVFGGLKQRFIEASQGDEPKTGWQLRNWLDEDMEKCVKNKKDEMLKIIRGYVKNVKYPGEGVLTDIRLLIGSHWINRLFTGENEKQQYSLLHKVWGDMSEYGKLGEALRQLVKQVISELPKEKDEESEVDEPVDDDD